MTPTPRELALARLARLMAEQGTSQLPKSELADLQPAVDQLIGAGALVEIGDSVRFAHESLRDFAFARAFAIEGASLIETLIEGGQDLSQRSLVRQILTYQRGLDRSTYSAMVEELLSRPDLRFHIRDVVFDVVRTDDAPRLPDWAIIEPLILDRNRVDHLAAWSAIIQPSWFDLLDHEGIVLRWFASEQAEHRDVATDLLRNAQRHDPGRVAEILTPFVSLGGDWPARIRLIITHVSVNPDTRYARLLIKAVMNGILDDGNAFLRDSIWWSAHEMARHEPAAVVDLLDSYLRRGIVLAGDDDPFEGQVFPRAEYGLGEAVRGAAHSAPFKFVSALLPQVLEIASATATQVVADRPFLSGDPWEHRAYQTREDFHWTLYNGLDDALRRLAKSRPGTFRRFARQLQDLAEIGSVRNLLYRGWAENPKQFAAEAAAFLTADPRRLACGSTVGDYSTTRSLIASIQHHLSSSDVRELEETIRAYVPRWEQTPQGRSQFRAAQWQLIEAFDEQLLSDEGRSLQRELRSKFGDEVPEPPRFRSGSVGSPIDERAAERMTDADWRRAIRKYASDRVEWFGDSPRGGAHELAHMLETVAKRDPDRFARLAVTLRDDTHPAYVDALLRAFGDSAEQVDPGLLFAALRRFFAMPDHPGGYAIKRPLARIADQDIPSDILAIVCWYATEATDPSGDGWLVDRDPESNVYPNDAYSAGINSVRGVAAETLSALIWPKAERIAPLDVAIRAVVNDHTLAVRACAGLAVNSVLHHDEELGLELFSALIDAQDVLLTAAPVEHLLPFVIHNHPAVGQPVLARMLNSQDVGVQTSAGRLAAFQVVFPPTPLAGDSEASRARPDDGASERDVAEASLAISLSGTAAMRRGVAQVAAANVKNRAARERCEGLLVDLFDDDEPEVRTAAADWCRQVGSAELGELRELAERFISSRAYDDDQNPLLWALEESTHAVAEVGLLAVEQLLLTRGEEVGDIRTRTAASAGTASELAFRAYTSASSRAMRDRALDVIDRLLSARVSQMSDLVAMVDDVG